MDQNYFGPNFKLDVFERQVVILSDSEISYTLANLADRLRVTYLFYKILRYHSDDK